jgi:hypothetical protein
MLFLASSALAFVTSKPSLGTESTFSLAPNCAADLNGDGCVNGKDLTILLAEAGCPNSGTCSAYKGAECTSTSCPPDLNNNNIVDINPGSPLSDDGYMKAAWGACPGTPAGACPSERFDLAKYGLAEKPQCPGGSHQGCVDICSRGCQGGGCPHSGDWYKNCLQLCDADCPHAKVNAPSYPTLPSSHTADNSYSGQLVWAGNESSSFDLKKKRMDIFITSPYPLGKCSYFYTFDGPPSQPATVWAYMPVDPQSGLPSCASTKYQYYEKWNMPDRPDALAYWNATQDAKDPTAWNMKTVFHTASGVTESGVLKLDADGNPATLDFHIMGDPNPALESVAYSNYKAGVAIDPAVFTLPDVCHQGTANRFHGGGARQALDLLVRR